MDIIEKTDLLLEKYGITPSSDDLQEIRKLLNAEIVNVNAKDNEYLKTLCILLFIIGNVEDSILIWKAKNKNFDSFCFVEIELLFGAGYDNTVSFLTTLNSGESKEIFEYIKKYNIKELEYINKQEKISEYKYYYGL